MQFGSPYYDGMFDFPASIEEVDDELTRLEWAAGPVIRTAWQCTEAMQYARDRRSWDRARLEEAKRLTAETSEAIRRRNEPKKEKILPEVSSSELSLFEARVELSKLGAYFVEEERVDETDTVLVIAHRHGRPGKAVFYEFRTNQGSQLHALQRLVHEIRSVDLEASKGT